MRFPFGVGFQSVASWSDVRVALRQNEYGQALRFNMVHYFNDMHGMPGGCADSRNLEREKKQFRILQGMSLESLKQ
jgi:hypothetical protein